MWNKLQSWKTTQLLAKEKLESDLKQQLEGVKDILLVKDKQYRELQR